MTTFNATAAVASDRGLRREDNEDAYCARQDLGLFMVADGMGGHAAGEVASRLAVQTVEAFVGDTSDADPNRTWPFPYDPELSLDANRLRAAFRLANRRIAAAMGEDDGLRGMATTAAAVLLGREGPVVAHVGDSRVYRYRAGALTQITQDHSWVSEQVRAGILSDADARRHPWRNVVTRALSGGDDPEVEVRRLDLESGDRLLICSDGLSGVVTTERMQEIVGAGQGLDETCRALIAAANEAGGPDNITVAMLQVDVA
ncbi:MAG TPA: PP2C family serine/threonine-protein phosphatase [Vicinamibacterales bacterium]|nr:PP2C family serine/threonine-protein phosphatase [Vicinamibacterales bacterium]